MANEDNTPDNPLLTMLKGLVGARTDAAEKAGQLFRESLEKVSQSDLSNDDKCMAKHVAESTRGDTFSDFMTHLHHLAKKHDCIEAAEAGAAVVLYLKRASAHLKALDERTGSRFCDPEDQEYADASYQKFKTQLERIQQQQRQRAELLQSLNNEG